MADVKPIQFEEMLFSGNRKLSSHVTITQYWELVIQVNTYTSNVMQSCSYSSD
jgi:hypothetical protein